MKKSLIDSISALKIRYWIVFLIIIIGSIFYLHDANPDDFIYFRKNPRGKHSEFWHHIAGCRQWFKVLRSTATHEIFKTVKINEEL